MAYLTKKRIQEEIRAGEIQLDPKVSTNFQPASIDLRLHPRLKVYKRPVLDYKREEPTEVINMDDSGFVLMPDRIYLGRTIEKVGTAKYATELKGTSTAGRLGISVHYSAPWGDPGFVGTWTLQLGCKQRVRIYPGLTLCQIVFATLEGPVTDVYRGKYQGQVEPTAARGWIED